MFDDMVTDMETKKISVIVTVLFLRGREPDISPLFISQSYSKCLKL